jgi:hypothetical protein
LITSITNTTDRVVVGISRAGGNLLTSSSDVLSTLDTDTGLQGGIISLVVVAVGLEVADDTVSIGISGITEPAFTGDSIEGFIGSTSSTGTKNPVVILVAITLSVLEVTIDTTILVTGASTVDYSVSRVANATVSFLVPTAVERTHYGGFTLTVDCRLTIRADTLSIHVGGSGRTEGFTKSLLFSVSRFTETSIRVAVIILTRVAVGTNSLDSDVLRSADASLGGFGVVLVDTRTGGDVACLSEFIVALVRSALTADAIDDVVSLSAVTLS